MRNFWIVVKFECLLIWRNWGTWLIALVMVIIGALAADNNRNQPWGSWGQIVFCGLFISLILSLSTGNQINRDRERRLDGVVFSTPVATTTYVLGKYCAALFSLLVLTGFSLLIALLTDQFYSVPQREFFLSPILYSSLGPQLYVNGWLWLIVVPVIFGATFMFAGITLTRGKRVIAYIAAVMIWIIPLFISNTVENFPLDITTTSFRADTGAAAIFVFQHNLTDITPPPQLMKVILHLSLDNMPPSSLLSSLLWNRLLFLALATLLLCFTIFSVQRARRHA